MIYKNLVQKISIPADRKTKQKDYLLAGQLPIIDQGKKLIGGYSNDLTKTISCDLPVIVFGDHTKVVKYISFPFGAGADGIKILKPKENIFPKYLYYATQYLTLKMEDKGYARHYQHLEKKDLSVPPLEEQQRIVARIEELFSELDAAVATLERTKEQLAVYRQAVLKEAFESLSHDTPYPFIKDVCHEVKVGIVIKPKQYYTDKPNGIRAFRSANVREFYVNDSDWVYLTEYGHEQNKRSEIHTGDVLVVRSGYPGTACVVPEEFNNCNAIDILIAVPNKDKITSEYLCAYTNSPHGRKLITEKKRGVAQAHLNVGGYSQMTIPVPDIETQKQIVDGIELKLSIYDNIMKTLDDSLQEAEAMRQSILKQAFNGELN